MYLKFYIHITFLSVLFISCSDENVTSLTKDDYPEIISLGRGSGMHGLNLVEIDARGNVVLYKESLNKKIIHLEVNEENLKKMTELINNGAQLVSLTNQKISLEIRQEWEKANLTLSDAGFKQILESVYQLKLFELKNNYYNPDILDGTQWILRIKKDGVNKAVYFNNKFPAAIKEFSKLVDEVLKNDSKASLIWSHVDLEENGQHDDELWSLIKGN